MGVAERVGDAMGVYVWEWMDVAEKRSRMMRQGGVTRRRQAQCGEGEGARRENESDSWPRARNAQQQGDKEAVQERCKEWWLVLVVCKVFATEQVERVPDQSLSPPSTLGLLMSLSRVVRGARHKGTQGTCLAHRKATSGTSRV